MYTFQNDAGNCVICLSFQCFSLPYSLNLLVLLLQVPNVTIMHLIVLYSDILNPLNPERFALSLLVFNIFCHKIF